MRILLIGGSKSGKSLLAQQLCLRLSGGGRRVYWATMEPVDGEDRARIARHLRERDGWGFETVECGRAILRAADRAIGATVLFDSATALLACEMFSAAGFDPEAGTGRQRSCWSSPGGQTTSSASVTICSATAGPTRTGRSATAGDWPRSAAAWPRNSTRCAR